MLLTGGLLAILAVLLADPVPRLLSRARWVEREPVAALVLWQAVGLAAGLSLLGAGLELAFHDHGTSLPGAVGTVLGNIADGRPLRGWGAARLVVLVLTVALGLRLFWTLVRSIARAGAARRQQHDALDILATPWPVEPGVLVLDHPTAVAYCLPGAVPRLVVSRGTLDALTDTELRLVLAHERAHLRLRHDVVVLPFVAWGAALPFLNSVRRAQRAVAALVEMMADDAAAVTVDERAALRTALCRLGGPTANQAVALRSARLDRPAETRPGIRRAAHAAAAGLLLLPTLLVLVPAF
ncbi:M56 family metallopeptidase [Nakamurella deserti]|uniref:M56 family metallopeptidase n=1 Tax=Nakamurella deserti TaxID=2164074 RepID=UPI0013008614|nr:M56 family metallopeptidase [Nakamurella deserti]